MQISDLIPIGKLGISLDNKDGFLTFRSKESISLDKLKNIFLVFSDHRVRYVTIDKIAENSKNQFSILETEVLEEIENVKKVQVMLEPEVWENIKKISANNFKDYDVYYQNKIIGKIVDTLNNPAQLVLIIQSERGEFMVPYVKEYVVQKEDDEKYIIVQNIQELLQL